MRLKFIFLFLLLNTFAHADEILRPQSHADHPPGLRFEYARKIKGAQVAWANYEALRRDFPEIESLTDLEINRWLETNLSYIGSQQSRLNNIRNTPVPIEGDEVKEAFRPEGWHRSAQLEVRDSQNKKTIGMVDIKGFGYGDHSVDNVDKQRELYRLTFGDFNKINSLRIRDHSDGLMSFGEAIAETTRQMAIQKLFEMKGLPFETVETYAVFRLPFNILKENSQEIPAGFYVRQAHTGRADRLPVPKEIYIDNFGYKQMTDQGTAVDFGGAIITDPLLKENYGAPELANPQSTKPWVWGHEVALAFDRGDTDAVFRHVREMLSPLQTLHQISRHVHDRKKKDKVLRRYLKSLRKSGMSYENIKEKIKEAQNTTRPKIKITSAKNRRSLKELQKDINSEEVGVVNEAIKSLDGFDFDTIEPILNNRRLLDKSPHALTITKLLSEMPEDRALPLLKKIYGAGNRMLRSMVLGALKNKNGPLVLDMIENSLKRNFQTEQESAVTALSSRPEARVLKLIKIALKSPYATVREAGIAALAGHTEDITLPIVKNYVQSYPFSKQAVILLARFKSEESLDILINDYYLKNVMSEFVLESLKNRTDVKSLNFLLDSLTKSIYRTIVLKTLASRSDLSNEQRQKFASDTNLSSEIRYLFYKSLIPLICTAVFQK